MFSYRLDLIRQVLVRFTYIFTEIRLRRHGYLSMLDCHFIHAGDMYHSVPKQ